MALQRLWPRQACHLSCLRQTRQSRWFSSQLPPAATKLKGLIRVSEEVREAIAANKPVVALESTIYTHGALGRDLPGILNTVARKNGAVPATIGVIDGVPTVGLTELEIDRMVDEGAKKLSRRDFAHIVGLVSKTHPPPKRRLCCFWG